MCVIFRRKRCSVAALCENDQAQTAIRETIMIIRRNHLFAPAALGCCLLLLLACAPPGTEPMSEAQIPALAPGMARVWFLRDKDPQEQHGMPIIYANNEPIGRSRPGTAFFRDFPPGSHVFTVQSYDIQTEQRV